MVVREKNCYYAIALTDFFVFLSCAEKKRRIIMFRWAIIFAVIALIASFLGFGGVAGLSANLAYVFLAVAVILFIIAFISRKV